MRETGNFPLGAENDPSAPWNQEEPEVEERSFSVCISQTLSKTLDVYTSDYNPYDTENTDTDWKEVCDTNGVYTPLELIEEFRKHLLGELDTIPAATQERFRYINLIKNCEDWIEDECEVIEE